MTIFVIGLACIILVKVEASNMEDAIHFVRV